jgi:hypothetical protein
MFAALGTLKVTTYVQRLPIDFKDTHVICTNSSFVALQGLLINQVVHSHYLHACMFSHLGA